MGGSCPSCAANFPKVGFNSEKRPGMSRRDSVPWAKGGTVGLIQTTSSPDWYMAGGELGGGIRPTGLLGVQLAVLSYRRGRFLAKGAIFVFERLPHSLGIAIFFVGAE